MKEIRAFEKSCPQCHQPVQLITMTESIRHKKKGSYECLDCGITLNLDIAQNRIAKILIPLNLLFAVTIIFGAHKYQNMLFFAWIVFVAVGIAYVLIATPLKRLDTVRGSTQ